MDLLKLSMILFCVWGSTMLPSSLAQDSPQNYLDGHNKARAEVGVGPVQWSKDLESYAQTYANRRINDCKLIHSNGPYGENLAWGSPDLTGIEAAKLWVNEKQYYNYNTNSCASGKVCGHYTQVVWKKSTRIGCAKVKCTNNRGTFIICNYDPRGNIVGQKPY